MEIVLHDKKSLFQQKFQNKLCYFNGISQCGNVWYKKWSNWTSGVGVGKNIRLQLPGLSGFRLHPKTFDSDSPQLWLQREETIPKPYSQGRINHWANRANARGLALWGLALEYQNNTPLLDFMCLGCSPRVKIIEVFDYCVNVWAKETDNFRIYRCRGT